ncbi:MAG: M50 family metallopeptidase [Alphaproteobacteria bacterium]|nr:M50 family metallopeptidase [Alphaproteobacteria bacterium]MDD9919674.1 M50 family metallopeptidase [Alphaproteobacteria bacterium]
MITTTGLNWNTLAPYFGDYGLFVTMVFVALILGVTPLRYPFQWLETYYHELSHGLAAIITFGFIHRIKLNIDGSGWCSTRGGNRFIILISGYMGAALWGGYLYLAGWALGSQGAVELLYLELALLAITTLLWVRDPVTLLIIATMALVYGSPILFPALQGYVSFLLQFTGIYVMLNAIRAPLNLVDGKHVGDGAALADITYIVPKGIWILFWFVFALAVLTFCAATTLPGLQWILTWIS